MKIYNKVVIDISTNEVIEEDSFEYSGPVSKCKSSGGGGASGKVDFPDYMKTQHEAWLGDLASLIGSTSNPYSGETAYDPDSDISYMLGNYGNFINAIEGLNPVNDWLNYLTAAKNSTDSQLSFDEFTSPVVSEVDLNSNIDDATNAQAALLADRMESEILPRFEEGMRDINAVISSSFVIGKALLEGMNTRDLNKFDADLRLKTASERAENARLNAKLETTTQQINDGIRARRIDVIMKGTTDELQHIINKLTFRQAYTHGIAEAYRIKVAMKNEELDNQLEIDDAEYKWPLSLYQYGANMMSSISGSAVSTDRKTSKVASSLGGAMSGAAMGGALAYMAYGSSAGPWGMAAGAVVGLGMSLFS